MISSVVLLLIVMHKVHLNHLYKMLDVKLLKSEPAALAGVNEKRKAVGLRALR